MSSASNLYDGAAGPVLPTSTFSPQDQGSMKNLMHLPPSGPCVVVALISGVISTLSVIVIAYPVAPSSTTEKVTTWSFFYRKLMMSQSVRYVLNIILSLIAICFSIYATGLGPVAVATPIQVGSNLLSNMLLQWSFGMIKPTKDQVVGTMTLAAAVTLLPDIGPDDLSKQADVVDLLMAPSALLYIALSFMLMASGILALAKGWVKENERKLLIYALVGGTTTVLSASMGKALQMIHNVFVLVPLIVIYALLGIVCLGVAANANATLQDPSTYVPIASGVQLVCTCFAGLFIWGDFDRLQYPLGYSMIYVLVVLGTYGVSSFDLLASYRMEIAEDNHCLIFKPRSLGDLQKFSRIGEVGNFGAPKGDVAAHQFNKLVKLWNTQSNDQAEYAKIVQRLLKTLVSKWQLRCEHVVELVVKLLQEVNGLGPSPSPVFTQWVEEHMKPYLDHIYGAADEKTAPLLSTPIKKPSTMPNLLDPQAMIKESKLMDYPGSPRSQKQLDYDLVCDWERNGFRQCISMA